MSNVNIKSLDDGEVAVLFLIDTLLSLFVRLRKHDSYNEFYGCSEDIFTMP